MMGASVVGVTVAAAAGASVVDGTSVVAVTADVAVAVEPCMRSALASNYLIVQIDTDLETYYSSGQIDTDLYSNSYSSELVDTAFPVASYY